MIKCFTLLLITNLIGSFSLFSQDKIDKNLITLDSLFKIQAVTEDFLYERYDCPAIKVDSSIKVESFVLNLKEVNELLDALLVNHKVLAKESIVSLYDKLIDKTHSPHSSAIILDLYNRSAIHDCDPKSSFISDYRKYWSAVSKFEHLILLKEISDNPNLTPFMAYELLSDEHYDLIVKKNATGSFPFYWRKIPELVGGDNRNIELFWESDYNALKNGLIDKIKTITLDSSNHSNDYLKDVFLIKQSALHFQHNPITELEQTFSERLDAWADNGFLYFVLQTTPKRTDTLFIKKIIFKLLYSKIQEGYMNNDYFMRALVLGTENKNIIRDVLLSEASKNMSFPQNPALKYLEKIYDTSVHDFLLNQFKSEKTHEANREIIRDILIYQYKNLLRFKRGNSDRDFIIR